VHDDGRGFEARGLDQKVLDDGSPTLPLRSIDRDALDIVRRLRRNGHTAYLVGGCVRDLLLGLTPKDFDVATSARPEEIRATFRNCRIIGRRFRLAHVFFRGGKIIETATFRAGIEAIDPDEEGAEGQDLLIRQDNVFGTEEEDARRRDFTINGLFFDPTSGRIIDYVGGLEDIRLRRVRMIGSPDIRLREDPVRILRALRIAAKTDLSIDPDLRDALPRHRGELARCAKPRLFEETMRLFRGGRAEQSLRQLVEFELLEVLVPTLAGHLRSVDPGHAEPAVFGFMRALDRVAEHGTPTDVVILGALLYAPAEHAVADVEGSTRQSRLIELILEAALSLGATRKMLERLRQVLMAQRHFERNLDKGERGGARRPRRRAPMAALAQRPHFAEALDLYEIIGRGTTDGEPIEALRGLIGAGGPTDDEGDEEGTASPPDADAGEGDGAEPPMPHGGHATPRSGRRRRRRRGGKGRSGGEAQAAPPEA
jgi:poly(A) polymerase